MRGKRGRPVACLISKKMDININSILENRKYSSIDPSNKFVFAVAQKGSVEAYRGSHCIRQHRKLIPDLECPDVITTTQMRKHVPTLSQLLNLEENEIEMLATFLGHDIKVHREYYRLPNETLQVAKCSKLLLAMEKGVGEFSGKKLQDLDLALMVLYIYIFFIYIFFISGNNIPERINLIATAGQ